MQELIRSHGNVSWIEVILNCRIALNNVSSSSSVVQVVDSSSISIGIVSHGQHKGSVLEGSGDLISLESHSQVRISGSSGDVDVSSFEDWNISGSLVDDVLAIGRNSSCEEICLGKEISIGWAVVSRVPEELLSSSFSSSLNEVGIIPVGLRII